MASTISRLRLLLLALLVFGLLGTGAELLLLEHTETFWQWLPLAVILLALPFAGTMGFRATRANVRGFQAVMALLVVTGGVGLVQHYQGNAAFELEMRPGMGGFELFREAMMGATPTLAPGLMAQLGLLGLAITYRHPQLAREPDESGERGGTP